MEANICKCSTPFTPSKGLLNHCSMKCRNSHPKTEEQKQKLSEKMKLLAKEKGIIPKITKEGRDKVTAFNRKRHREALLNAPIESLSFERLARRIKLEQDAKCNKCGNHEWLGQPIVLELEHKDGNRDNRKRENLEGLCPNCHSQTKEWRGRKKKTDKITDEQLTEAIISNNYNFRQALISVGLAPKGGNYKRCHYIKKILMRS